MINLKTSSIGDPSPESPRRQTTVTTSQYCLETPETGGNPENVVIYTIGALRIKPESMACRQQ